MQTPSCHPPGAAERPKLDIADIFRTHGEAFRSTHTLTPDQHRAMRAIETCRTATLGGHVDVCDTCGFERPAYNSCRNRHCPKCQGLTQARWLEGQMQRILPTRYFHVVFTLPSELRDLTLWNRRAVFDILFQAASATLLELGRDPHRLGALLGFTAVLHTWTRDLRFHPHLHVIVTCGGLRVDDETWASRHHGRYLFPVAVLGDLFRGKFMAALLRARRRGALRFLGPIEPLAEDDIYDAFKAKLYSKDWVVYAKRPFGGVEEVYRYLGRYTHRTGISNARLLAFDENGVRFSTKNGKAVTLPPEEFIRRFLLHVLPGGFVKIRHYGLFAAPNAALADRARTALESGLVASKPKLAPAPVEDERDWRTICLALTGLDLFRCPRCDSGTMIPGPTVFRSHRPRSPPHCHP